MHVVVVRSKVVCTYIISLSALFAENFREINFFMKYLQGVRVNFRQIYNIFSDYSFSRKIEKLDENFVKAAYIALATQ